MSTVWWILVAIVWIASLIFFPAALMVAYLAGDRTLVAGRQRAAVS